METIECNHQETVRGLSGEFRIDTCNRIAICKLCGQVRQFKDGDEWSVVIRKLGRIDGKFVLPKTGAKLLITPEESRLVREGFDRLQEQEQETKFQKKLGVLTEAKPKAKPTPPPSPEGKLRGWEKYHADRRAREAAESSKEPTPQSVQPAETIEKVRAQAKRRKYPRHRKQRPGKYERDMKGILADCGQMPDAELECKWGIARGGFYGVKKTWRARGIDIPVFTPVKVKPAKPPKPKLTPGQRSEINRRASMVRWDKVRAQRDKVEELAKKLNEPLVEIMEKAKEWRELSLNTHLKLAYLELEVAAQKCLILEQAKRNTLGRMIL